MEMFEIHTLWGVRKGLGPEYAELMVAWDEFQIDENPEGFREACEEERASWGDDLESERFVVVLVDRDQIAAAFDARTVTGEVVVSEPTP